jgi:hypothetical protein
LIEPLCGYGYIYILNRGQDSTLIQRFKEWRLDDPSE